MSELIGIGVGPGDPDLLTVKAVKAIQNADIIMCPASKEDRPSIALSVVDSLIDKSKNQEIVKLIFPMTKDKDILEAHWKENSKIMAEKVLSGKNVVYLTAEKFMYQFIKALRFKNIMSFKEQFRSVDVLMILTVLSSPHPPTLHT